MNEFNDELVSKERTHQSKRALERLPPELREVIILFELEVLSYKGAGGGARDPDRDGDVPAKARTPTPQGVEYRT